MTEIAASLRQEFEGFVMRFSFVWLKVPRTRNGVGLSSFFVAVVARLFNAEQLGDVVVVMCNQRRGTLVP